MRYRDKPQTKRSSQNKHTNDLHAGYARRMRFKEFADKWRSRGE